MRPSYGTLGARAAKDCANRLSSRVLDDEEHGGEDDAEQETDDKIEPETGVSVAQCRYQLGSQSHPDRDGPDRDVLHFIDPMSGVPDRLSNVDEFGAFCLLCATYLLYQIDTENKDQGSDNHDSCWSRGKELLPSRKNQTHEDTQ